MELSVVIPAYNAAATIADQLEALAAQVWRHSWEVIVADNGSSDETAAVARCFHDRIPHLRVIDASARRGAAHARNVGVRAARSARIAFCDADDVVENGWVAAMGEALSRHDFIACRLKPYSSQSRASGRSCPQQDGLQRYMYPEYLPHGSGQSLGVTRAVHERVGGFDESLLKLQDTDYCWRIQLAGTELHFVPEAVVRCRFRENWRQEFRQSFLWGEYNVLLYKRYRSYGMPKLTLGQCIRSGISVLRRIPRLINRNERAPALWFLSWRLGRFMGSIKYHTLAL